jgi:hypothetical protein
VPITITFELTDGTSGDRHGDRPHLSSRSTGRLTSADSPLPVDDTGSTARGGVDRRTHGDCRREMGVHVGDTLVERLNAAAV